MKLNLVKFHENLCFYFIDQSNSESFSSKYIKQKQNICSMLSYVLNSVFNENNLTATMCFKHAQIS